MVYLAHATDCIVLFIKSETGASGIETLLTMRQGKRGGGSYPITQVSGQAAIGFQIETSNDVMTSSLPVSKILQCLLHNS